ncbi:tRNA (adenosine(37)-N6)-threonylcarbamoyltransferase complex ATPase subunit type 1 TsaE [Hymenobacter fodinae]|uniref:tRNA threonylcarbamoyladenosine biosynthesis protein TsaE n=1 Tax=Hymenobacter fodinae TaxID=2510796 RepID=A0A4Z0P0Y8_9BACT|nr:tRNA (adenosine(37)-N6)-threonylcarbamoyltransferase complex ATPase subunit type 1 TsaE [Hymenobacter fodinae]TGE04206.1 tRNA (adenosine(37)-N6)-threonylcarbamoyltransferase complex ATPase subunit type 1 TsaE [Hymenobacter fodinae]
MTSSSIHISSLDALPQVAAQVRDALGQHSVICFEGEMGAGKTTFIKVLCQSLGVQEEVSSPTFSLVNEYRDAQNRPIYHFDFYRLNNPREAEDIGALEYFDSGYLCLIEWPSRIEALLPSDRLLITLTVTGLETRELTIES